MTKENSTFMAEFACSDARKIADKSNSKLLETLLEKFKNMTTAGCKSLAIFDIDSTLLDMSYRTGGAFSKNFHALTNTDLITRNCVRQLTIGRL